MVDFNKMMGRSADKPTDPSPSEPSPSEATRPPEAETTAGRSEPDFSDLAPDAEPGVAPEPEPEPDGEEGAADGASPGLLTREQFFDTFCGLFAAGGAITGLQSLPVGQGERPQARAASDALYDTALEVEALRFLIEPGNKWVQRALVVGVFAFGKYQAAMGELRERRRPGKAAGSGAGQGEAGAGAGGGGHRPPGILAEMEPDAPERDRKAA